VLGDMSLEAFENDWQRQWLVERGIEWGSLRNALEGHEKHDHESPLIAPDNGLQIAPRLSTASANYGAVRMELSVNN
jgi:hypothetical protein